MVTCPNCIGRYNPKEIELQEINTDCEDYFFCKKCNNFSKLEIIDKINELELPEEVRKVKRENKNAN